MTAPVFPGANELPLACPPVSFTEAFVEVRARVLSEEILVLSARALKDTEACFDAAERFTNRSIGQRRRFLRARQIQGERTVRTPEPHLSNGALFVAMRACTKLATSAQNSNGKGYLQVSLWTGGIQKLLYVHRLVLSAFSGEPGACDEACHNDGNRAHNNINNLRWDTKRNNHADRARHGTLRNGEEARAARLTKDKAIHIRQLLGAGAAQADVARLYSVAQPTISDIHTKRTWKHI